MAIRLLLLWILLVATVHNCGYAECCVEEERLALLEIKAYMEESYSHYGKIRWSDGNGESDDCCAWKVVQCNTSTGRVTQLHLGSMVDNNDVVMNPPWLFNATLFRAFRQLIGLDLSSNSVSGLVDHGGSTNLRQLQLLDLSQNNFDGSLRELFTNITYLEKLQVLYLDQNYFHGHIQDICKLKDLQELYLQNNLFHGVFPSCFQNLSSLQIIDLSQNHFNGKVLTVLSSLKYLGHLDLSDNNFEGKLSLPSLANLSKLHTLRLSGNSFEIHFGDNSSWQPSFQLQTLGLRGCNLNKTFETFRKFLSHQTNLSSLDLSHNNIFEAFPTWLFNITKLKALYLANNLLTGSLQFPSSTNMWLHYLDISNNNLHDELPENIGLVFPNLEYMNFSGNRFEGLIPTSIGHMREIRFLDLSRNNFFGELPKPLLSDSYSLEVLDLSDNNLEGDIIPDYMNLPGLSWFKVNNNHFSGTIKDALRKSSQLYYMDISNNRVNGRLPWWIRNFTELYSLSMSQNNMHGRIPTDLHILYLDLSQNNFSGSIPCSTQCSFGFLHLHGNSLTGPIPKALSSCSMIETLDLRDNQLSGGIPLWIHQVPSLTVLLLAGNNLQGSLPVQLCQLDKLSILDLSRNQLSGGIPICFGNMSIGKRITMVYENTSIVEYDLDDGTELELYDTTEEVEFQDKNQRLSYLGRDLVLMSGLDLSCNNLSGNIPPQLGDLEHIQSLNLSHNFLSGPIPSRFSNLKHAESLDLSYNNLSGNVPSALVELNFLAIFNVSYNNLSGSVPETGQFANFDESNYYGNPGLYGYHANDLHHPNKALPPATRTEKDEGERDHFGIDMVDFLWSFSMSCVVMFLATVAILYINPQWRRAWFEFVDFHIFWRLFRVSISLHI